jgi:hypothetical protein
VSGGEEMGFIFDEVFFRIEYFNNLLEIGEWFMIDKLWINFILFNGIILVIIDYFLYLLIDGIGFNFG